MTTAIFQGTLNVPLFYVGYTVPDPTSIARFNMYTSENAVFGNTSLKRYNGSSTTYASVQNATVQIMTYTGLNTFTIGGGYATGTGLTLSPSTAILSNLHMSGLLDNVPTGGGNWASTSYLATKNISSSSATPINGKKITTGFATNNAFIGPNTTIGSFTDGIPSIGTVWIQNYGKGFYAFSWNSLFHIMTVGAINIGLWSAASIGAGSTLPNYFIIKDSQNNKNWMWRTDSAVTGAPNHIRVSEYVVTLNFPSLVVSQSLSGFQTWNTDDASINAIVQNAGTGNYFLRPVSNGVILSISGSDYYVSKDGTKYWLINAFPAASGVFKNGSFQTMYGDPQSLWIDPLGVAWYIGSAVRVGTTIFPAYSLGFNLIFNPPTLPNVPPLSMPCWDPCLGVDVGIDKL